REMAEELRRRGVLDESEEFYLKALELNRLDYRIYVGLAETYLQINKFDKAKIFLEKSLPHAPSEEIDYKSYSYRLIGHIYACEEDYNQAVSILRSSIELSPTYEDGHYDYAQYCAQIRNKEACLSSLEKAILAKPLYWYLAHKERSFGPVRSEVEKLLARIRKGASSRAKDAITNSESPLKEAREAVFKAKEALIISKDKAKLNSSPMCGNAEAKFELAKEKGESGDYVAILEAKPIADEAHTIANETKNEAYQELKKYQDIRAYRVKKPWKSVHIFIWLPLVVGLIAGIGGCTIGIFVPGKETTGKGFSLGFFVGLIVGFILCIYIIKDALEGK
ncbi:MAG: hypothetical protein KJ935_06505, partial [Candidatus Omnitrophica bacterium]|nr:hypothetical protein [Candidatus Omnitrophota bacterium]